jgi:tight adherence protein C
VTVLISLLAALGAVLIASGLPAGRRRAFAARVEPYLAGLHGRPSSLLGGPQPAGGLRGWLRARLARAQIQDRALEARLAAAGLPADVPGFRAEQLMWAAACVLGVCALVALAAASSVALRPGALPPLALVAAATGWLSRDWWLQHQTRARRERLLEELPTAIDLLVLALLAGESVTAAFARVADEVGGTVGDELGTVVADVRAGSGVVPALERLAGRSAAPGITRLVDALCTGIERGAPLAEVLRNQADDAREARRRGLIESGGRREVLMLVPVVFLIMPTVIAFALFPGLVSLDLLVP